MLGKWAASSESASHILSILKLAKYDPQIIIPISALDMNPWLFNCQNGTLDLRSGELRPFSQLDYITKISNFDYEEGTQSYMWDTFLRHVMQENDEMIAFLQRAVGYCMTGLTHEDCFFLPWGPTRTGKSTFIHAIEKVFGDYGQSTRPEVFMRKNSDPIPNEIAALQGIRLSTSVETEGGQQLAVSQMKRLTGGEAIRARFMYREFFQFTPTFHIWIATNNRPVIPGNDSAIWERLRLIPFTNPFTLDIRDRDFRERLPIEAGKAILAWMVEGCKKWQERGLGVPPLISEAIESYREDMDDIAQFIDEICVKDANSTVLASQLYDAFTLWARMKNIPRLSLPQFKDDLLSRGYNQTRTSRGFIWRGLKLTNTVIELGDAASGAPVL
jgi:putative DNA primase/helicase